MERLIEQIARATSPEALDSIIEQAARVAGVQLRPGVEYAQAAMQLRTLVGVLDAAAARWRLLTHRPDLMIDLSDLYIDRR